MAYSVLLIADEPNFRSGLQHLLEAEGYAVAIVHSGQKALAHLEHDHFVAVLLDPGLPDLNSSGLVAALRENYPEIAIIVLGEGAGSDDLLQVLHDTVYDALPKPVADELLLRTLRQGIAYKRLEQRLQESEKRFCQLSDATWEGIVILENDNLLHANQSLCSMFGYDEQELLGQPVFDILLDRNTVISIPCPNDTKTIGMFEAMAVHKNGRKFPVTIKIKKILYGGRPAQVAAILDLTATRMAQEKQMLLQRELADAKRMEYLGLMAGSVAHDLNNIMAGILTYPELLLMDLPEDFKYRKEIEMIRDAGKRAAAVVNDLLTLARGTNSKKDVQNLNELVSTYLDSIECKELHARYPDLSIITDKEPELSNVRCSPVHVNKSLVNLVNNGAEAAPQNGTVTIATRNQILRTAVQGYERIEPGEYVVLEVRDNGHGIGEQDLPHIFDPFYSKKVLGRSGTGLGLAVVWNTVHDHGGYIDVTTSSAGTTFSLYFPVTSSQPDNGLCHQHPDTSPGCGEQILVVDDQQNQLDIASRLLGRLGYIVHTVNSGEEAVEFIKKQPVDLVLLDMVMDPGINGCETFERIVRHNPNQKAIIISGYSSCPDVNRARELGINQFIKKPYTLHDLSQAVRHEIC